MNTQPALDRFEVLFAEHGEGLYRFCYRLTGNRSKAEDLAQDTFLAALEGKSRFEGRSSVKTWLYQIAFYKAREYRERGLPSKRTNLTNHTNPCEPVTRHSSPESERMLLDQAIEALPDKEREAFVLVKVEQFSCQEAAAILKLPVGTVKYHVFQAVKLLRKALAGCGWESSEKEEEPYAM